MADPERVESSEPRMPDAFRTHHMPNRRQLASKMAETVDAHNHTTRAVDHLFERIDTLHSDLERLKDWRARGFWGRLRWFVRGL